MDVLNEYKEMSEEVIREGIDKGANEAKAVLRSTSPVRHDGRGTPGVYRKSWRVRTTVNTANKYGKTVYASGKQYALTHLLENGHALWQGGRSPAIPHIGEAQKQGEETAIKTIEGGLGG